MAGGQHTSLGLQQKLAAALMGDDDDEDEDDEEEDRDEEGGEEAEARRREVLPGQPGQSAEEQGQTKPQQRAKRKRPSKKVEEVNENGELDLLSDLSDVDVDDQLVSHAQDEADTLAPNFVACKLEKRTHTKEKWRWVFRHGVARIHDQDFLFDRAVFIKR